MSLKNGMKTSMLLCALGVVFTNTSPRVFGETVDQFVILADGTVHVGTNAKVIGGFIGSNLDPLSPDVGDNLETVTILAGASVEDVMGMGSAHLGTGSDTVVSLGGIIFNGNVQMLSKAEVFGDIHAGGAFTVGTDTPQGNATIGSKAIVHGSIYADHDVDLNGGTVSEPTTIEGDIHAGGSLIIGSQSLVMGDAIIGEDAQLNNPSEIQGIVHVGGDLDMNQNTTISNNALVVGDVDQAQNSVITGNLTYGGALTQTGAPAGTVNGTTTNANPGAPSPTAPQYYSVVGLPTQMASTADSGDPDIVKLANQSTDLAANTDYDVIDLGNSNTLTLHSGTYNITDLDMNQNGTLIFDFNLAMDPIILKAGVDVRFGTNLTIKYSIDGGPLVTPMMNDTTAAVDMAMIELSKKILFFVGRDFSILSDPDDATEVPLNWLGIVIAGDDIHLGTETRNVGAMYAYDDFEMLSGSFLNGMGLGSGEEEPPIVPAPSAAAMLGATLAAGLIRRSRRRVAA